MAEHDDLETKSAVLDAYFAEQRKRHLNRGEVEDFMRRYMDVERPLPSRGDLIGSEDELDPQYAQDNMIMLATMIYHGSRETAGDSMDLDYNQDLFEIVVDQVVADVNKRARETADEADHVLSIEDETPTHK